MAERLIRGMIRRALVGPRVVHPLRPQQGLALSIMGMILVDHFGVRPLTVAFRR